MRLTKKKIVALALVATGALTATGAYAYWTTTGSGEGSAASAASNGTVVLSASFDAGIYPGGEKVVTYSAQNDFDTDLYVGTVTVSSIEADDEDFDVSDFSVAPVAQNVIIENNDSETLPNTGLLKFANSTSNQDACKGATITLNLTSN